MPRWELEFYEDESGREPVHDWIFTDLEPRKRRALVAALEQILQEQGINVCGTPFGDNIGDGIFEFRLKLSEQEIRDRDGGPELEDDERVDAQGGILLRVFCHAYADKAGSTRDGRDAAADEARNAPGRLLTVCVLAQSGVRNAEGTGR